MVVVVVVSGFVAVFNDKSLVAEVVVEKLPEFVLDDDFIDLNFPVEREKEIIFIIFIIFVFCSLTFCL